MAQQRLFAFITENPLSHIPFFRGGKYNGYVGIIEDTTNVVDYTDHRLFDTDYYINVHGGVTFDGTLQPDTFILPLTDIPENWYNYRVVGFDCNHSCDKNKERPLDYVKEQTISMMNQIEKHLDNPYNEDILSYDPYFKQIEDYCKLGRYGLEEYEECRCYNCLNFTLSRHDMKKVRELKAKIKAESKLYFLF